MTTSTASAPQRTHPLATVRATLLLFVGIAVVYVITANYDGAVPINDAVNVAQPAWEIAKNHQLALSLGDFYGPFEHFIYKGETRSDRFPGAILLAVPFYFFGPSEFSVVPGAVSAAVVTAGAMAVLHRALLRAVAPITALGAVLLLAFATGTWTVAASTPWTHGPAMLGLAIGMWGMATRRTLLAGLGYGLAILSRPHLVVVGAVAAAWDWYRNRNLPALARLALGAAVGVAVLLIYTKLNSGGWNPAQGTYAGRSAAVQGSLAQPPIDSWAERYYGAFLSLQRGVIVLSPFVLLLLPGVVRAWRDAPNWVKSSTLGAGAYLVLQLLGNSYKGGGGFFSYRVTLESVLLVTPLLALAWERWTVRARWRQITFGVLAAAALWWHALGAGWFKVVAGEVATGTRWDVRVVLDNGGALGVVVAALFAAAVIAIVIAAGRADGAATSPLAESEPSAPVDQPAGEHGGDAAARS